MSIQERGQGPRALRTNLLSLVLRLYVIPRYEPARGQRILLSERAMVRLYEYRYTQPAKAARVRNFKENKNYR